MPDLINMFPSILLGLMILLTLILLPLLQEERAPADERQPTDKIRVPRR